MEEKKNVWYKTDGVIIGLIIFTLFLMYGFAYILYIINSDDKTLPAFTVITGLAGIVVSIGTVYYVIKAYSTQKKQIALQKEEIESNKVDVEYNRAIDMIYKQLVYTNKRFNQIAKRNYNSIYTEIISEIVMWENLNKSDIILEVEELNDCIRFFNNEFKLYETIINVNSLNKDLQKKLLNVIAWNIKPYLLEDLTTFDKLVNEAHKEYIEDNYDNNSAFKIEYNLLVKELKKCVSFLRSEFDEKEELN